MLEEHEIMANLLPNDALANILCRLAPCYLAISRSVCKPWRTLIDTHCLLRADLLPHKVGGIFINFHDLFITEFFARPSIGPTVSGNIDYLPCNAHVRDHFNGLLLLHGYGVNPATWQWAQLPPRPSQRLQLDEYLVFDPTLSPHYEVFLIPRAPVIFSIFNPTAIDQTTGELEWPPSPCILYVFSSRTKEWEERSFVREGEAEGSVADMPFHCSHVEQNAVYWQGVLYINCYKKFVVRVSLSNGKYRVIKPPADVFDTEFLVDFYLGQSEKGVYCAVSMQFSFWIYILNESRGEVKWVFRHFRNLGPILGRERIDRPRS